MNLQSAEINQKVAYIPNHAHNNLNHPDVEFGRISSKNNKYIFVKFEKQLKNFGWDGTTAQACLPEDLIEWNQNFS